MASRDMSGKGARRKTSNRDASSGNRRTDSGLAEDYSTDDSDTAHNQSKQRNGKSTRQKGNRVKVALDFTNPDDLLEKLERLELTEEETEELLKQAYSINRKLKQEIRDDEGQGPTTRSAKTRLPPIGSAKKTKNMSQKHNDRTSSSSKRTKRPEWVD